MKKLAIVVFFVAAAMLPASAGARVSQHRIAVRVVNGDGVFVDRRTGARFVPRGNTFLRRALRDVGGGLLISHQATFDVGRYDAAASEAALRSMHAEGYNVVKVFLDSACVPICLGNPATGWLSFEYLRNVLDFLRRAKANHLAVAIAADEPPWGTTWNAQIGAPFDGFNAWYLTTAGVEGFSAFWLDLVSALLILDAPLDAVWAYELGGETWFQPERPPLSVTHGIVTTANGRSYDLADPAQRELMLADGLAYFTQRVTSAIKAVDRTALVTMGFIAPTAPHRWRPGDTRYALPLAALDRTALDFLDLHSYPGWDLPLDQYAANFGLGRSRKPIVIGELGAYQFAYRDVVEAAVGLQAWQAASCSYGVDGWLLWTWDTPTPVEPRMWSATSEGGHLARALGPRARPDPCAPPATLSFPAP
jgi:hypothetical protein